VKTQELKFQEIKLKIDIEKKNKYLKGKYKQRQKDSNKRMVKSWWVEKLFRYFVQYFDCKKSCGKNFA